MKKRIKITYVRKLRYKKKVVIIKITILKSNISINLY